MRNALRCSVVVPAALLAGLSGSASAQNGLGFVHFETPHVSPLALTPSGATLLACNTPDGRLEVFDVSGPAGLPVYVRSIPVGFDPVSVRVRSETEAWVVNQISDSISVVDLASGRVVRTIQTGDEPSDVVFAGSPQRAFVSVSALNQILVLDPANPGAAPVVVPVAGKQPRALATDGTRVYAAIFESGNQTTILSAPTVSGLLNPYPGRPNPPPNTPGGFSPAIAPGLPPPPPVGLIVKKAGTGNWRDDNNGNWSAAVTWDVLDNDVAILSGLNGGAPTVTYARGLMNLNMALAVNPNGRVTVVGTDGTNEKRFEPNVNGTFVKVVMGSFDPAAPGVVTVTDLNPHLTYTSPSVPPATRNLSVGDPRGVVWSTSLGRGFVAGMGSNNILVLNPGGSLARVDVPAGPTGLALNDAAGRLYVLSKFAGQITLIDAASATVVGSRALFDATPQFVKNGRKFLYDTRLTSGLGQASCGSCHVDGKNDGLTWDLGDPSGTVKVFNQICAAPPGGGPPPPPGACENWHPMKGPMATQTLVGIVGNGPMHWRGDRENLAAFNPAFASLMGSAQLTAADMQSFEQFVGSISAPPNPNRNLDNTLRNTLTTEGRTGNPVNGQNLYLNAPLDAGAGTCNACHALPNGGTNRLIIPRGAIQESQSLKTPQLRNMYRKTGFSAGSLSNLRGFGFSKDGSDDTLITFLRRPVFAFPAGAAGDQQRRDLEAFMMSLDTGTHAAVGQQVTLDGTNNSDPTTTARLNTFVSLASATPAPVGLVVKGRYNGLDRGFVYIGGNNYQSDRVGEVVSHATLTLAAGAGAELTWTVVPIGTQRRAGIDRDADGSLDRDELDLGSDPNDPASRPPCPGDVDGNRSVGANDLSALLAAYGASQGQPGFVQAADIDGNGSVGANDLSILLTNFGRTCL
ncbi:MAG: hypothetical protein IBJ11_03775 [Phycisphaerales bacterium]|nr:hypothetical protein [Phycisphaerales bacterium]